MQKKLLHWYLRNKRNLPWRLTKDPYSIWISEVMLQQTTVQTVIPYFEKFMARFPTLEVLAQSPIEDVLAHWSGLGYYSRARNLHKAAQDMRSLKSFPRTSKELIELPGFGPYTSAAVASIAFGEPVAAVDGNVNRVISRLFDIKEGFAAKAQEFLNRREPSDHNQAMMELGATICTPRNPACLICPLADGCLALQRQTVHLRPPAKKRRATEKWVWNMWLSVKKGKVALTQASQIPWLKGVWVLPGKAKPLGSKKLQKYDFSHQITHHKIYVHVEKKDASRLKNQKVKWISLKQMHQKGVSSVVKKALSTLSIFLLVVMVSCSSKPPVLPTPANMGETSASLPPQPRNLPSGWTLLTAKGENVDPRFSFDGQKLAFVRTDKSQHRTPQIYIRDLGKDKERQFSFNAGQNASPQFSADGKEIYYASTMDEIFESSKPGFEIYGAFLDGSRIRRLTQRAGFDGEPHLSFKGNRIYFSTDRKDKSDIWVMDLKNKSVWPLLQGATIDHTPALSPDGKTLAWVRDLDGGPKIYLAPLNNVGKGVPLFEDSLGESEPAWSADSSKLAFVRKASGKDIFFYDVANKCLRQITDIPSDEESPQFSPDGKRLLFVSNLNSTKQIYSFDLSQGPSGACNGEPVQPNKPGP